MPELRHDPIQKRWVIISTERGRRPTHFRRPAHTGESSGFCPFCPGNESKSPGEIVAVRPGGGPPDGPGWQQRVVPNKFPALSVEGDLDRTGVGLYDRMNGVGAHEIVIESPDHHAHIADMPIEQIADLLKLYRARLQDLLKDQRFKYVMIFKNWGEASGATLDHPHSQVIATPVTPRTIAIELTSAHDHYNLKERCLFCDILRQELEHRERMVYLDERFAAFAPYASRFPFETWIMPRTHSHDYAQTTDEELHALARALRDVLRRIKIALNDPPYNFVLHSAPNTRTFDRRARYWDTLEHDWHWHFEIIPRIVRVAGFEWGSGFYINPTAPEDAAAYLREVTR